MLFKAPVSVQLQCPQHSPCCRSHTASSRKFLPTACQPPFWPNGSQNSAAAGHPHQGMQRQAPSHTIECSSEVWSYCLWHSGGMPAESKNHWWMPCLPIGWEPSRGSWKSARLCDPCPAFPAQFQISSDTTSGQSDITTTHCEVQTYQFKTYMKPSGTSLQANARLTPSPSRQDPNSPRLDGKSLETMVSSALNPEVMIELAVPMMLAASQLEPLLIARCTHDCHIVICHIVKTSHWHIVICPWLSEDYLQLGSHKDDASHRNMCGMELDTMPSEQLFKVWSTDSLANWDAASSSWDVRIIHTKTHTDWLTLRRMKAYMSPRIFPTQSLEHAGNLCLHVLNRTWQSQACDLRSQELPGGRALLCREALESEIEVEINLKHGRAALLVQDFHMVVQGDLPQFRGHHKLIRDGRRGDGQINCEIFSDNDTDRWPSWEVVAMAISDMTCQILTNDSWYFIPLRAPTAGLLVRPEFTRLLQLVATCLFLGIWS